MDKDSDKNNKSDAESEAIEASKNLALSLSFRERKKRPQQKTKEDEGPSEAELHQKIVQDEIAKQKRVVREKYSLFQAIKSDGSTSEVSEHLSPKQFKSVMHSINAVFPDWMKKRHDFQQNFPRFAKEVLEHADLVEIAMSKEAKHRTSFDIEQIVKFMTSFDALKHLSFPLCEQLCKILSITKYPENRIVYKIGEPTHKFYMILRGSVQLTNAKEQEQVRGQYQCFGEEAIFGGMDAVRVENAVTKSDSGKGGQTVLLELNAGDYRTAVKIFSQIENSELSNFLGDKVEIFKSWSKHRVNQITPVFEKRCFKHGEIIQSANDQVEEFCIIRSGICEVFREIEYYRKNRWPKIKKNESADDQNNNNDTVVENDENIEYRLIHEFREMKLNKLFKLAELDAGDYFGQEFLVNKEKHTSVRARGPVEILVLNSADTRKHIPAKLVRRSDKTDSIASEDEIRRKFQRNHRLKKQYEQLKLVALGPRYHGRIRHAEIEKKIEKIKGKRKPKHLNKASSCPVLPHLNKRLEKAKYQGTKSTASLPPVI